jgi:UDP-4-amino-4,6-dideoxy-N-acetyl-beta-L-altrosamine transaminase
MIPYGRQSISDDDIAAVVSVLRSDFLTQGPVVPQFEQAIAQKVGATHAVAVNSATSALHIACMALDVGPGDMVWTSPNSFVASANCAIYCGAKVDFVDIDPTSFCMSEEALAQKLADHTHKGLALPKVVIPVHFGGQSCHMAAIATLAKQYGFKIIEDASHAIGGHYRGSDDHPYQPVGNCRYSDICIFSFHPVKIITTGEGGIALTNSPQLADRLQRHRSHGITSQPSQMQSRPESEIWNYQQVRLGYNYRLTDIQAALGLSQLSRLEEFVHKRQSLAQGYDHAFSANGSIQGQFVPSYTKSARHLYVVQVPACHQKQIYKSLYAQEIQANLHYIPIHLQPFYQSQGFKRGDFPNAEHYFQQALSLPLFPDITKADQNLVISKLIAAVKAPSSVA